MSYFYFLIKSGCVYRVFGTGIAPLVCLLIQQAKYVNLSGLF